MLRYIVILVLCISGCKAVNSDLSFNLVESKNKYGVAPTVSFKMSFGHNNTNSVSKEKKDGKEQSGKEQSGKNKT